MNKNQKEPVNAPDLSKKSLAMTDFDDDEKRDIARFSESKTDERKATVEKFLFRELRTGNAPRIKLLLEAGIDANAKDKGGHTPLSYTVMFQHEEATELLISYGANVNEIDKFGLTPLDLVKTKNQGIAEILIRHGGKRTDSPKL